MRLKSGIKTALLGIGMCFAGCNNVQRVPEPDKTLDSVPVIFPDYSNVTIPCNIAPLNFRLEVDADDAVAVIEGRGGRIVVDGDDGDFVIPGKAWKSLLASTMDNDSLSVTVYAQNDNEWTSYRPFYWFVSSDGIDSYLAYRLIEPGYELWHTMGIYQRNLSDFEQKAIITNEETKNNCMNCHSFNNRSSEQMIFHMREKLPGTYLVNNEGVEKLITSKGQSLVYPFWHPSGKFIAFSSNQTKQGFHMNDRNLIEVYDISSDLLVYDLQGHRIISDSIIASGKSLETFPTFSPDGKKLYFCSAEARSLPQEYDKVKYNLCSVDFDVETGCFGDDVDTLFNAIKEDKSVSFPRISPDGKWMMFTVSDYGNFSIWHKSADLVMIGLEDGRIYDLSGVNSDDVESYHSWSSNGRWVVFSSRRMDGLYTCPFIVYVDKDGKFGKPFVLPQKSPEFYRDFMYSFNIPEFVNGQVEIDKSKLLNAANAE